MKTKLDTVLFVFEAVEAWVTDPEDQRKIVAAYRMRAELSREIYSGHKGYFSGLDPNGLLLFG